MSKSDIILAALLTGEEETDHKLRQAFELGLRHGRVADRKSIQRSAEIDATKQILLTLMRVQQLDLAAALATLQIPRKERETYVKLLSNREKQQQIRKKR